MSTGHVEAIEWHGRPAARLNSDCASLVVVPELGAKIVSLTLTGQDGDFIWQDGTRPLVPLTYGGEFGGFDAGGFDECFPTIAECSYPAYPWDGIVLPDHGEVWTLPWRLMPGRDAVHTAVHGVRFPYELSRRIRAARGGFVFEYVARNLSSFPMQYLWSAHPLLALSEGTRVLLPGEPRGRVIFAVGGRIAPPNTASGEIRWPWAPGPDGTPVDCSLMGPREWRANDKVCLDTPPEGWCALYDRSRGRYCGLKVSRDDVPYIAVCANFGWYPPEGRAAYWVAIEPCTGFPDSLSEAAAAGRGRVAPPMGQVRWTMALRVGHASTAREVAARMERCGLER